MFFFLEMLRLGLNNLLLHKLRSLLTALGIIFGVFAVIMMIAIGEGNKQAALAKIRQLGARNIILKSVKPPESDSAASGRQMTLSYGLKRLDLKRIQESIPAIDRVAPLKEVGGKVIRQQHKAPAVVYGTTPDLIEVTSMRIDRGRYLSDTDINSQEASAVLGAEVARRLFPLEDPLNNSFLIGKQRFVVVGILQEVGLAGGAGSALVGRDLNFDVHIPITTAYKRWGDIITNRGSGSFDRRHVELSEIYLRVSESSDVLAIGEQVRQVIQHEHGRQPIDIKDTVPLELLEQERNTRLMQDTLLVAIACISLLVGGIGIMNIMLASVTERTREIGIRRAVGATREHIILQFLVETTFLSFLGGALGVALGIGGAMLLDYFHESIPGIEKPAITLWSILLSFIVATGVGIIFGLYPAIQASKQDPIVALRHD